MRRRAILILGALVGALIGGAIFLGTVGIVNNAHTGTRLTAAVTEIRSTATTAASAASAAASAATTADQAEARTRRIAVADRALTAKITGYLQVAHAAKQTQIEIECVKIEAIKTALRKSNEVALMQDKATERAGTEASKPLLDVVMRLHRAQIRDFAPSNCAAVAKLGPSAPAS